MRKEQQQNQRQSYRNHHQQGVNGILQVFKLPSIGKVITGLQTDILFQRMLNIVHYLLNISPTHIHPYHNATLRRITVNLQRTVHQVNGSHLADGYLYTIRSAHKELVKIQVLHFIIIQPEHKVETTFILKTTPALSPA